MQTRMSAFALAWMPYQSGSKGEGVQQIQAENRQGALIMLVVITLMVVASSLLGDASLGLCLAVAVTTVAAVVAHWFIGSLLVGHGLLGIAAALGWLLLAQSLPQTVMLPTVAVLLAMTFCLARGVVGLLVYSVLTLLLGLKQPVFLELVIFLIPATLLGTWVQIRSLDALQSVTVLSAEQEVSNRAYAVAQNKVSEMVGRLDSESQSFDVGTRQGALKSVTLARDEVSVVRDEIIEVQDLMVKTSANRLLIKDLFFEVERLANLGAEQAAEANTAVHVIASSNREVVDIVSVVDEIAFQTNLLALNASVEAARAGPSGAGFSVVATEVRNLAQRSADSAREIRRLIDESTAKIQQGLERVRNSRTTSASVIDQVHALSQLIDEVSISTESQARGVQAVRNIAEGVSVNLETGVHAVESCIGMAERIEMTSGQLRQGMSG